MCFRTRQALHREENKAMRSFEGSFHTLKFSPTTSILLNFFFPFIGIKCFFFSSLKLQYRRTIVLLNKLTLFIETSFSKATMVMRFPAKKNAGCPKAPRNLPPRKDGILHSRSGCLGTSLPLPHSLPRRTLTSQPKFFGSIDYQISLAMELCWRALPAGSAKIHLQISRIRVARLSICFGLQHWNFSHTITLFELARRSEGFDQQIKSEKHS